MVPVKKEDLRKLVTETTVEIYEELTPQLIRLIDETKHNEQLTEAQSLCSGYSMVLRTSD